jgi:hypothetical protein
MPPKLDARGLLPHGVFECADWDALANIFAVNPHRVKLLASMQDFVRKELTPAASGLRLQLGGSYLSDKAAPEDIDCTVILPFDDIPSRGVFMQLMIDGGKGRIWEEYKVEIYPTILRASCNNLGLYFQYVGEKTAATKNLKKDDLRGIIELKKWTLG